MCDLISQVRKKMRKGVRGNMKHSAIYGMDIISVFNSDVGIVVIMHKMSETFCQGVNRKHLRLNAPLLLVNCVILIAKANVKVCHLNPNSEPI